MKGETGLDDQKIAGKLDARAPSREQVSGFAQVLYSHFRKHFQMNVFRCSRKKITHKVGFREPCKSGVFKIDSIPVGCTKRMPYFKLMIRLFLRFEKLCANEANFNGDILSR